MLHRLSPRILTQTQIVFATKWFTVRNVGKATLLTNLENQNGQTSVATSLSLYYCVGQQKLEIFQISSFGFGSQYSCLMYQSLSLTYHCLLVIQFLFFKSQENLNLLSMTMQFWKYSCKCFDSQKVFLCQIFLFSCLNGKFFRYLISILPGNEWTFLAIKPIKYFSTFQPKHCECYPRINYEGDH